MISINTNISYLKTLEQIINWIRLLVNQLQQQFKMEGYQLIRKIDQNIALCKNKSDQKIAICKRTPYKFLSDQQKQALVKQVNILRHIKHPNIIRYYDRCLDKFQQILYVYTQYCPGGNLESFIQKLKKQNTNIPQEAIWKILMQILMAVHEIHRRKDGIILHRAIRPSNIYLDANNNVKLGNFGFAKKLNSEQNFSRTLLKDVYYMSPQQLKQGIFSQKTDIWSIGCLLYQIVNLHPPFQGTNLYQVAYKIKNNIMDRINQKYSKQITRVKLNNQSINWCLIRQQKQRPNIDALMNLPEISMKLREKRLQQNKIMLKKRQEQLIERQSKLKQRQNIILKKKQQFESKQNINYNF